MRSFLILISICHVIFFNFVFKISQGHVYRLSISMIWESNQWSWIIELFGLSTQWIVIKIHVYLLTNKDLLIIYLILDLNCKIPKVLYFSRCVILISYNRVLVFVFDPKYCIIQTTTFCVTSNAWSVNNHN